MLTYADHGPILLVQLLLFHGIYIVSGHVHSITLADPSPKRSGEGLKLVEEESKDDRAAELG